MQDHVRIGAGKIVLVVMIVKQLDLNSRVCVCVLREKRVFT
jgi:hypothetical protein